MGNSLDFANYTYNTGDIIQTKIVMGFYHYAFVKDENTIIHLADPTGNYSKKEAIVYEMNIKDFFKCRKLVAISRYNAQYELTGALSRAESFIGKKINYNFLTGYTCDGFVNYVINGKWESPQITQTLALIPRIYV